LQLARVTVTLRSETLDVDLVAVKVHDFAVLCVLVNELTPVERTKSLFDILNLTFREFGSVVFRGSSFVLMVMPLIRALGGR
jgi:hypothetical protein